MRVVQHETRVCQLDVIQTAFVRRNERAPDTVYAMEAGAVTTRTVVLNAADMLARAWTSVPPDRRAPSGALVNAVFGAARALRRILSFKEPSYAVAVMDLDGAATPWREQRGSWVRLLDAHGVEVVDSDDPTRLVAAYVGAARELGHDVVIGGSDKRLGQLVADQVWWYEGHKDVRYTPEAIRKRFGVPPEQLADWLALVGLEDVLAGVPGIGAKGAVTLLEAHGSLHAALQDPGSVHGRVGKALRANLERAAEQRAQAWLTPAPAIPRPLDALPWRRPTAAALDTQYRDLGFFTMLTGTHARPARDLRIHTTAQEAHDLVSELVGLVAIEPVIDGPSPVRGVLVGLGFATEAGGTAYVPVAPGPLSPRLTEWLEGPQPKAGHDTKALVVALRRRGITLQGVAADTALASHQLDPAGMAPHGLGRLARAHLQRALPTSDAILGKGARRARWADLDPDTVGAWAGRRADAILALWGVLGPRVDDAMLGEALQLDQVLVRMDLAGMPIDAEELARVGRDFEAIESTLQREVHRLAGKEFSINSNKQLGSVLFEDLELPVLRRTKTGWSVANEVLQRLADAHPVVPLVIRYKQLRRMRDTWVTALSTHISDDSRIHSSVHGARSFSGRLINTSPDLGRTPGRTPELNRIRQAFIAPKGHHLLSVDYDQLGLYVLAHLTGDPALVEPLLTGGDLHRATAAALLDKAPDALTADERQLGKVVNFATFAGQGASALALQLGSSVPEAKRLIAKFYERYAVVGAYQEAQLEFARAHGYVTTLAGRKWWIGHLTSREPRDLAYAERMARRAGHEGSVADVTRRGLLRADQALRASDLSARPLVQILDEVVFEVPIDEVHEAAHVTGEAMQAAFELRVPLRVSSKAGPTWGDLTPLE